MNTWHHIRLITLGLEEETEEPVEQIVAPIVEPEPVVAAKPAAKKKVVRRKKTVSAGEGA